MKRHSSIAVAVVLLAAGCAGQPLVDRTGVDVDVPPQRVAEQESPPTGMVNWGGRIVEVHTVDETTELEILSFPLSASGRPKTNGDSDGRFIAVREGFVDPLIYDKDKHVSLIGRLQGVREGTIGERAYRYPVVTVTEMAPAPPPERPAGGRVTPFFSIGVGVGF